MKPWTFPELLAGYVTYLLISEPFVTPLSRMLQRKVCSEAQIELFSARYGTSPRLVYANASRLSEYETSLLRKIVKITYEGVAKLFRESSQLDLGGAVSHQLPLAPLAMPLNQRFRPATFTSNFWVTFLPTSWRQPLSSTTLLSKGRTLDLLLVSYWKML